MFKRYAAILVVMLSISTAFAQRKHRPFNPAEFEKQLEQYIASHASLMPNEAAEFFPVYREMRQKQMRLFHEMKRQHFVDIYDDRACREAIKNSDNRDLELKKIQQEYHNKFLKILKPSKVFAIIRAEDEFHKQMFKDAVKHDKR